VIPTPPPVDGIVWRPATVDDVDAIVALQDACFRVDDGYREVAAEVVKRFEDPMADPTTDSLLGVTADGLLAASIWSWVVPEPVDSWKVYDDNYVHPDDRTDQLLEFVLSWWMERSLERIRDDGTKLPVVFHQHLYPNQRDHIARVEALGFRPASYFDELRRDLSDPIPDRPLPVGFRLVPHGSLSAEEALGVRNDAFRDHRGSQPWTMEMWMSRDGSMSRPDASFAILDEAGQPAAYTLCDAYPHDAQDRGYTEGWISGVGTARAYRGMGLASKVICESMKVYAAEGLQYATLEVDTENPTGAAGLYANLGFERVRGYINYTKTVELEDWVDGDG
jgi:ribosomal protein S18 acetylase RimI-like enzyme